MNNQDRIKQIAKCRAVGGVKVYPFPDPTYTVSSTPTPAPVPLPVATARPDIWCGTIAGALLALVLLVHLYQLLTAPRYRCFD